MAYASRGTTSSATRPAARGWLPEQCPSARRLRGGISVAAGLDLPRLGHREAHLATRLDARVEHLVAEEPGDPWLEEHVRAACVDLLVRRLRSVYQRQLERRSMWC